MSCSCRHVSLASPGVLRCPPVLLQRISRAKVCNSKTPLLHTKKMAMLTAPSPLLQTQHCWLYLRYIRAEPPGMAIQCSTLLFNPIRLTRYRFEVLRVRLYTLLYCVHKLVIATLYSAILSFACVSLRYIPSSFSSKNAGLFVCLEPVSLQKQPLEPLLRDGGGRHALHLFVPPPGRGGACLSSPSLHTSGTTNYCYS